MKTKKKSVLLRIFLYGALLFALSLTGAILVLVHYKPMPIEVSCIGDSGEMGQVYGHELRFPIKLLLRYYIKAVVCYGREDVLNERGKAACKMVDRLRSPYATEMQAVAEASDCDLASLAYANCFLDMGNARAGCRSVVAINDEQSLHAHNLDWENLGGLAKWMTTIVRRQPTDGRLSTVSVGFPGMIGSLDIINEYGIAFSFNQLGFGQQVPEEPIFLTIRRLAETCTTFDAVHQAIMDCPPGVPFILTVSSAAERKAAVYERLHNQIEQRGIKDGWVAACNTAQGRERGKTILDQQLLKTGIANELDMMRILGHDDVVMDSNIYSVVFDFDKNRLLLASGIIPAAKAAFREFHLFATPKAHMNSLNKLPSGAGK